ncbi:MAG TPA: site-2 protease family protein [Polyangiaceae bacterium]|nr:site-2 protease family protein [Polyangiaceae bacterium]
MGSTRLTRARELGQHGIALLLGHSIPICLVLAVGLASKRTIWPFANALLVIPLVSMTVTAHEASHAFAGILLGMRPSRVALGFGPKLFEIAIKSCRIQVHAVLNGGMTVLANEAQLSWVRLRFWLTVAAGPAFNLLLLMLLLPLHARHESRGLAIGWAPVQVAWFVALFAAAYTLIPFRSFSSSGDIRNDLWLLLAVPFWREEQVAELKTSALLERAAAFERQKRFDEAFACFDQALAQVPNSYGARLARAALLIRRGQLEQGRKDTVALLTCKEPWPAYRLGALNNIAWADLLLDRPELVEEAARYSSEVVIAQSRVSPYQGTRGLCLVTLGDWEEGMAALRYAFGTNLEAENRALNACSLALGLMRVGKPADARQWIETARSLDSSCLLLARAEGEVEGRVPCPEPIPRKLRVSLAREHQAAAERARERQHARAQVYWAAVFVGTLAVLKFIFG